MTAACFTKANGIELCYETFGDPDDVPLLLVMGLGAQMITWPVELCEGLVDRGFHVIRYDNRDAGLSTRFDDVDGDFLTTFLAASQGDDVEVPYRLSDLAADGMALLHALGIESAHVVGASMGGMIAQTMAIMAPERVLSLTSIMSTTGRRTVGWQSPSLLPMLVAPRRPGREAYVQSSAAMWKVIGSPGFPSDTEVRRRRAEETFDRGFSASGVMRQMLAIITQPNRTVPLRSLGIPAMVIHGLADKMVHVSGGRATASAVPGTELLLIDGMGHDLPAELFDTFVEAIRRTADRAERADRAR